MQEKIDDLMMENKAKQQENESAQKRIKELEIDN